MNDWLIFIFGLVVGLYIKAFTHYLAIKAYLRFLFGDEEVNNAVKKNKSKFSDRMKEKKNQNDEN